MEKMIVCVTTQARDWSSEWGWYRITKEIIQKISGLEQGLGSGVAPPGMYVG